MPQNEGISPGTTEQDPGGQGNQPAPAAKAGAGPALKPSFENLRAIRERRRKRWMVFTVAALVLVAGVIALAVTHWVLGDHYRAWYHSQPWIDIAGTYRAVDHGLVLAVHREKELADLERRIAGSQAYAIGFVTRVEAQATSAEAGAAGGSPPTVELVIDVPNFEEEGNLFDDEVRVRLPVSALQGVSVRDFVLARGVVTNFSRFGLWLDGTSLRKLGRVERWYTLQTLPAVRQTREAYGLNKLREKKKRSQ